MASKLEFPLQLQRQYNAPLDVNSKVETLTDLETLKNSKNVYEGMLTYCVESSTLYIFNKDGEFEPLNNGATTAENVTYQNDNYASLTNVKLALDQSIENTNQISIINKTKYIFFGDSYAEGYSPDGNTTSWWRHVRGFLKISNDDYYSFYKGGYGFANGGFMSLLTNAINTITDKYNVKYIIVGGGYNDATEDYITELPSKMKEWIDLCRTNFPNAKILIAPFGWCVEGLTTGVHADKKIETLIKMVLAYQRIALINGACYIDGIYSCLHDNKFFSSDYVHPNNNGQYNIALQLANYLKAGGFNTSEYMSQCSVDCFEKNVYENGITSDLKCWATIDGKTTILSLIGGVITGTFYNLSLNGSPLLLGTVRSATINGINYTINFNFPAILKSTSSKYYKADATLRVIANKLYIGLVGINDRNDNFISDNFTEMRIYNLPTTLTINSLLN